MGTWKKKTAPNQSSPEKCKLGRLQAVTLLHAAWLLWKQRQKQKQSQWRGGCGEKGSPVHCGEDSKLAQTFSKTAWGFLEELKIEPPYHMIQQFYYWAYIQELRNQDVRESARLPCSPPQRAGHRSNLSGLQGTARKGLLCLVLYYLLVHFTRRNTTQLYKRKRSCLLQQHG